MIHGNLKKWEIILLGSFVGSLLLMKAADEIFSAHIHGAVYFSAIILCAGVLLFNRPIRLALNIRRIKRESVRIPARVTAIETFEAGKGKYKIARIVFSYNGKQHEYPLHNLLTFRTPKVGDEFEVLYNESRPDELLVASFYVMSAMLWVVFGILVELPLVMLLVLSLGGGN